MMRPDLAPADSSLAITLNAATPSKDAPPWYLFEKASLIDVSANKQWIAYITKDPTDNNKYLKIRRFKISDTVNSSDSSGTARVDSYSTQLSGTSSEDPEKLNLSDHIEEDDNNLYYFLSISPTGKRVALSFVKINRDGEIETQQKIHNPDTIIFKVGAADNRIRKAKSIKFQGRAVFLKNGNLALINKQVLEIYDCQRHYRKIHWFNLYPLTATRGTTTHEAIVGLESLVKTSYVHFDSRKIRAAADLKDIIRISKHIRHNVLTTTYHDYVSRVWSITEDGVRLTSFHSLSMEEIMAFSLDYKYLATFVEKDRSVNVYNVKSGLVVSRLKQDDAAQANTPVVEDDSNHDFQIYVCFCHKSQYLAMVSISKLKETNSDTGNNALISFQVWNIMPEKSVYYATEEIRVDWDMQNKCIQPFVDEEIRNHVPTFRAVYSTIYKSGMVEIKVKELDIFNSQVYSNREQTSNTISRSSSSASISGNVLWQDVPSVPSSSRHISIHEERSYIPDLDNDLDDYNGLTCFQREIDGRSYLLRFGKKTVQLWQVSALNTGGNITAEDKLIYIRAFKTPFFGFNDAYKDKWSRKEADALADCVNCFQDKEEGRIVISIMRDTGILDEASPYVMATATAYSNTPEDFEDDVDVHHTVEFAGVASEQEVVYENDCHHTEEIYLPIKYMNNPNDTSFVYEFHYVESACQALHYLWECTRARKEENQEDIPNGNIDIIFEQTKNMVKRSIRSMRGRESKYFTTISGSNTLAMLASFELGREIIFDIIETEELPITLFSYVRLSNSSQAVQGKNMDTSENALTILIEEFDYDLYELLFNRVILYSKKLGTGCFSAVTDALIFLQERGNRDLLLSSTQKLSYLQIDKRILTILTSEVGEEMHMSTLHKDLVPDLRDLESHSTREQVTKYSNHWLLQGWLEHIYFWWSFYISHYCKQELKKKWTGVMTDNFLINFFKKDTTKINGSLIKLCVVPLPHFNSYNNFPEDRDNRRQLIRCNATEYTHFPESRGFLSYLGLKKDDHEDETTVIPYKPESAFIRLATNQHENDIFHQGDTVLEVLLQYKWEKFARKRFLMVYLIYLAYYISYSVGVSFPREVFGYELGTPITNNSGHLACIILMFISGGVLFLQEVHQLLKSHSKSAYLASLYNIIDIAAFIFPAVTFWQILTNADHLDEVSSVSTLILWLHGILRLRVISLFGITLETIIQLVQSVYKVLIIMLLVIIAFTNSFMVLLSRRDDSFFQEQFEGTLNLTDSGLAAENSMSYSDISANNNFNNPFKSFSILWFCIFGVWDPMSDGDAGDDYMVMVLAILFSFLTALIFFNLVIALMSSKVEEVRTRGKKVWISHFAGRLFRIDK
ncbi:hypothetical protein FB192DRAFT_1120338 [Mucor lusitanicus]|uniref:Ion transport domain-containing protein n=1 Tax=Mucor circinelloides f. lusitanicus TaxID=29924 RepID=A0A8H4F0U2_MUCCL|nr:hypothetical protein FB192DRAFT_1120338 [Mucor lusitanicus]